MTTTRAQLPPRDSGAWLFLLLALILATLALAPGCVLVVTQKATPAAAPSQSGTAAPGRGAPPATPRGP